MPSGFDRARQRLGEVRAAGDARLAPLLRELTELREWRRRGVSAATAELAEFARSGAAPPGLRAMQHRIDRGELTWEGVVLGSGGDADVDDLHRLLGDRVAALPARFEQARKLVAREGEVR